MVAGCDFMVLNVDVGVLSGFDVGDCWNLIVGSWVADERFRSWVSLCCSWLWLRGLPGCLLFGLWIVCI